MVFSSSIISYTLEIIIAADVWWYALCKEGRYQKTMAGTLGTLQNKKPHFLRYPL